MDHSHWVCQVNHRTEFAFGVNMSMDGKIIDVGSPYVRARVTFGNCSGWAILNATSSNGPKIFFVSKYIKCSIMCIDERNSTYKKDH